MPLLLVKTRVTAMAELRPCQKCRKLIALTRRHTEPPGTLQRMRPRPDIGHVPDIAHDTGFQCVICEAVLIRTGHGSIPGWRFEK